MKKFIALAISFLIIAVVAFLFSGNIGSYISNSDLLTLEAKHTPEELMETHRKELLGNSQRTFQEPTWMFYPYLLMDVKYFDKNHKSKQGVIVWSLMDGEMVLDSDTWETTSGFEDIIQARAGEAEFQLLNTLAANKGALSKDKLQKELALDQVGLNRLLDLAKQKQLIVIRGGEISLHFENPNFLVSPETKLSHPLVVKPYARGKRISPRYSASQIEKIAKAAFGSDFFIRETKEIYLPTICLCVQNPDGTLLVTEWNALTGKKI